MTFEEILDQVLDMLRRRGRVSYRALKRQFNLDDDYLEDLKEELSYANHPVRDEDGRGLLWKGVRLAVRLGIHTGPVVVGEVGAGDRLEQLAMGETPNVASRLQGLAERDTVLISADTQRLVRGYFHVDDLGTHALKGVAEPMQMYRVVGESTAQSRLEAVGARGLTPLVGRDEEVGLLLRRWAQSREGVGQVVLIQGEAGIGK
jgi:hypothetical protein